MGEGPEGNGLPPKGPGHGGADDRGIQVNGNMGSCPTGLLEAAVSRRDFLRLGAAAALGVAALGSAARAEDAPDALIGFTELRTDLRRRRSPHGPGSTGG
jgi:hypothetical protein